MRPTSSQPFPVSIRQGENMPDEELIQQVVAAVNQLAQDSRSGEVDGEDVAQRLRVETEGADLYYAFKVADERGQIRVGSWPGGMGLPHMIKAS
jgi:hypothetical protein